MRKLKHFMLMALGLGLALTGCEKGGNGDGIPVDNRSNVVGSYPVKVTVPVIGELTTNLAIVKQGDNDLKASAVVNVPGAGVMNIALVLSELVEHNTKADPLPGYGYYFKVAEQQLTIPGLETAVSLKGTGKYDGHDGRVYKATDDSFIALEIADASGTMTVKVETYVAIEKPVDNRANVAGSYPVKITVPIVGDLYTSLAIVKDGDANLKASGSVDVPQLGKMNIALILSELDEYNTEGTETVTGYYYKIAAQEVNVTGTPMTMTGTGDYEGGTDGKVYKNSKEAFISLQIADASGNITVKVETGTKPEEPIIEDNRDPVIGFYPVKVDVSAIPTTMYSNLKIAREGDDKLKASATVSVPGMGDMNIELVLSDLEEYSQGGAEGFYFTIAPQELTIMTTSMTMKGTGDTNGHDGLAYLDGTSLHVSLAITNEDESVNVAVETGLAPADPSDPRNPLVDRYPVNFTVSTFSNNAFEYIDVSKYGNGLLKASASITDAGTRKQVQINLIISELEASQLTLGNGQLVQGYYCTIVSQEIIFDEEPVVMSGMGTYNGHDGKIFWASDESQGISVTMSDETEMYFIKIESGGMW